MAHLCLTRKGTHWMGLFRGLKLKTRGTDWTVVADAYSQESTRLDDAPRDSRHQCRHHAIRLRSRSWFQQPKRSLCHLPRAISGDGTVVFDPSPDFGMEDWFQTTRDSVRDGVILRLVPRTAELTSTHPVREKVNRMLQRRRLATGLVQSR